MNPQYLPHLGLFITLIYICPGTSNAQTNDNDRLKRERTIGRLEATIGPEATKLYMKVVDYNAGGDNIISAAEAPEFASNLIGAGLLERMYQYDANFPKGGDATPTPSFFPQKTVKPRSVYQKEWKEIFCEKKTPHTILENEAKKLGFSISEEAIKAGVEVACNSK